MAESVHFRTTEQARNRITSYNTQRITKRMTESYKHITSGQKLQTFNDSSRDTARLLRIQNTASNKGQNIETGTTVETVLQQMETSTRAIGEIIFQVRARLVKARNFGETDLEAPKYFQTQLKNIERELNKETVDGQRIWGGFETKEKPVNIASLPNPGLGDPVNYAYYQGTTDVLSAIIGEQTTVDYGITARESAFAKTIHALKLASTTTPTNDETTPAYQKLGQALDLINESSLEITAILQKIGLTQKEVEEEAVRQEDVENYFKERLAEMQDSDLFSEMTNLEQDGIGLKLSYAANQKMMDANLSLIENLRR